MLNQVKLQFCGHDRVQAHIGQRLQGITQDIAWVQEKRSTVKLD